MSKKTSGMPLKRADRKNQSASGRAYVGFAASMQLPNGVQCIIFAATMKTLAAAWVTGGGATFDAKMAEPVTMFKRLVQGSVRETDPTTA